jgi:hypothetical protein
MQNNIQFKNDVDTHILQHGSISAADLAALGAPPAPATTTVGKEVADRMTDRFGKDLSALAAATEHYQANTGGYRDKVDKAYLAGGQVPTPPPPTPRP